MNTESQKTGSNESESKLSKVAAIEMKYFGIRIEKEKFPSEIDVRDFTARLFVSPHISVEKVKVIVSSPGNLNIEKFLEITTKNINDIVERQNDIYNTGSDIALLYGDKIHDWVTNFGQVLENDLDYIEQKFRIKKGFFYKELQKVLSLSINSPRQIANIVKQYVKGQDETIERVAVPFFQHIESMRNGTTCEIKTAFLLAGDTGVGKSEMLRRFCQICNVPIVRINTSDCVPNGWRGEKISDLIAYQINDDSDLEKMKYAVLVFNEFDKICRFDKKKVGSSDTDWEADMQRDFLKLFDKGYELAIEKPNGTKYKLPTDNLLLCFDGAFSGIENIISQRLKVRLPTAPVNMQNSLKINIDTNLLGHTRNSLMQKLNVSDLEKWGYIPELLGRIGTFIVLNSMTEELLYEIITTASSNIIDAHKLECSRYGFNLELTDNAIRKISKIASDSGLGVRSVKTILAALMEKVYYDCDKYKNTTLTIDDEQVSRLSLFSNKDKTLLLNENNKNSEEKSRQSIEKQ